MYVPSGSLNDESIPVAPNELARPAESKSDSLLRGPVAIIGVGLMGGSLGLALRARRPDIEVVGWDDAAALRTALDRGAVTRAASSLADAVADAHVIVLATPVATALDVLSEMAAVLPEGVTITDLGSVKRPVAQHAAEVLPRGVTFIGGHPMAGSERAGVRHADALLFENATWVLCPAPLDADTTAYELMVELVETTGARVLPMTADAHDAVAARVSHLPQLLSVLLVNLASESRAAHPGLLDLAAGGFRDMTRIAGSRFSMWRDIIDANRGEIQDVLADFARHLQTLRGALAEDDMERVAERFRDAEQTRDFIPADRKGFLRPLSDVYVFVGDEPGALVRITTSLFEARINIKDIELLRIREGTGGTFRLGLETPSEAQRAVDALGHHGISAYRL